MLSDDNKHALWASVSPRVLVDVSQSQLLKCATSLDYVHLDLEGEDIFTTFIELHVIEAFYACVCTLGDDCYILNLTRAIAPWAFDRVEEHLVANGFDFSPATEGVFKQRLRLFANNPLVGPITLGLDLPRPALRPPTSPPRQHPSSTSCLGVRLAAVGPRELAALGP